jgi:hypothetical protein
MVLKMNGIGKGNFNWQELLLKIAQVWIANLHQRGVVGIEIHFTSQKNFRGRREPHRKSLKRSSANPKNQ